MPLWLAVAMGAMFNLVWMSYDVVFKPIFGDGERTEEERSKRSYEKGWCDAKQPLLPHQT